jgi:hypothetical protein
MAENSPGKRSDPKKERDEGRAKRHVPTRGASTATDPWSSKGVAINLSHSRREALKVFAESSGAAETALTPAQALYSLIDLVAFARADGADAEEAGKAALAETSGMDELKLEVDRRLAEEGNIEARLNAIERNIAALSDSMSQCASALEQVAAAVAPINGLLARLNLESGGEKTEPGAAIDIALPPAEWIQRLDPDPESPQPRRVVVALRLVEKRALPNDEVWMSFACRFPAGGEGSAIAPPRLELIDRTGGPLALCLDLEPRAPLAAVFSRGAYGWEACVSRLSTTGALGPVIYRARASAPHGAS